MIVVEGKFVRAEQSQQDADSECHNDHYPMAVWFHAFCGSGGWFVERWSVIPLEPGFARNDVRQVFYFILRLIGYHGEGRSKPR